MVGFSSNQKDEIIEARVKRAVAHHFAPNPWKDQDSLELELFCMYQFGGISKPEYEQGLREAQEHFDKKKKRRFR